METVKEEKNMENENIMENNEVINAAEDVMTSGTGIGLKLVGGALVLGGAIYGGIKLFKKLKAKKAEKDDVVDVKYNDCDECVED